MIPEEPEARLEGAVLGEEGQGAFEPHGERHAFLQLEAPTAGPTE